jgi:hypothetical protein
MLARNTITFLISGTVIIIQPGSFPMTGNVWRAARGVNHAAHATRQNTAKSGLLLAAGSHILICGCLACLLPGETFQYACASETSNCCGSTRDFIYCVQNSHDFTVEHDVENTPPNDTYLTQVSGDFQRHMP